MLSKDSLRYQVIARTADQFMTLDLTGVGSIKNLYEATLRRQPGPMCMTAAELVVDTLREKGGPAVIASGFPEGGGVPETDGPIGAALLARTLFMAFNVETVIITDEDWKEMQEATCRGAGLAPMPFPETGRIEPVAYLRPVYIRTVPKDWTECHRVSDELLAKTKPRILFAIERPGKNQKGVYHGLGGRVLDDLVGDLDYLFIKAKERKIPTIAFGDGGNELGMGVIKEDLPEFQPKARDCGCPCKAGIAADFAADRIITTNVSNWGATGLIAALAGLLENPVVFHDAELEARCIEICAAAGAVDGMTMAPEPAVDGIVVKEWEGTIRALRGSIMRTLGHTVDWKGTIGDWRQLK